MALEYKIITTYVKLITLFGEVIHSKTTSSRAIHIWLSSLATLTNWSGSTAGQAGSDCVVCQAKSCSNERLDFIMALRITRILRIQAVRATLVGFPAWIIRS